jgi:acyl-homoserine lactone synthase
MLPRQSREAMIVFLKGSQRKEQSQYFERMFRLRHQVFVKGLGWPLPSTNGQEIDQYDVNDAVYLIDVTDDDIIQGSVRLMPSETCSLVADYFPHLIESGVSARDPLVYECTRYIFVPIKRGHRDQNRIARARILSAMVEWCLINQLAFVQCVVDMTAFPSFVEMVPQTIPLGLPHPYGGGRNAPGGGECIAFRWPATGEVVDSIRAYGGMDGDSYAFFPGAAVDRASQLTH